MEKRSIQKSHTQQDMDHLDWIPTMENIEGEEYKDF
jgi:hypothetical protein